jgi:hypothetical protein
MRHALVALAAAAALGGCAYDTCGLGAQTSDACWICGWFEDACTERPPNGTCLDQECQLPAPPLAPAD